MPSKRIQPIHPAVAEDPEILQRPVVLPALFYQVIAEAKLILAFDLLHGRPRLATDNPIHILQFERLLQQLGRSHLTMLNQPVKVNQRQRPPAVFIQQVAAARVPKLPAVNPARLLHAHTVNHLFNFILSELGMNFSQESR